jgi:uncharacterized protein
LINKNLKKVIETSTLVSHIEKFICAKVKTISDLSGHFLVSQDSDEITVITKKDNIDKLDLIEKNEADYSLLEIKFSTTLNVVGFFAAASSSLAEEGISILAVSTYSKDYILVKEEDTEKAIQSLTKLGLSRR